MQVVDRPLIGPPTAPSVDGCTLPPALLTALAIESGEAEGFSALAEPGPGERTYACTYACASYDIWLIRWGPGSGTPLHDHGDSAGVVYVLDGELVERVAEPGFGGLHTPRHTRALNRFDHRVMTPDHVHEIANESDAGAASVHVYSPPLSVMHHYEVDDAMLRATHRETVSPRISPS